MLNPDYEEMLSIFFAKEVRFLLVGAYAMAAHGYPRTTGDIDLFVEPTPENSERIYESLVDFGAPMGQLDKRTFAAADVVFQIGLPPRRIDIVTTIDGITFAEAYQQRVRLTLGSTSVPCISKPHLIRNKLSTGREKDKLDAEVLKKL